MLLLPAHDLSDNSLRDASGVEPRRGGASKIVKMQVAIMYAGVVFFSEAVYGVLRFVTGSTRVAWVSVMGNFAVVTDTTFRETPRYETPFIVSLLVLSAPLESDRS